MHRQRGAGTAYRSSWQFCAANDSLRSALCARVCGPAEAGEWQRLLRDQLLPMGRKMREGPTFTTPSADHGGVRLPIWLVVHRGLEEESLGELPQ